MASEKSLLVDASTDHDRVSASSIQQNLVDRSDLTTANQAQKEPQCITVKFVPSSRPQSKASAVSSSSVSTTNPDYLTISSYLRNSICFGYPVLRSSHSKAVHSADIFKEHFETVALERQRHPQSFRRKKDWLGRWTEANIVRDRLLKEMVEAQKKTPASGASS